MEWNLTVEAIKTIKQYQLWGAYRAYKAERQMFWLPKALHRSTRELYALEKKNSNEKCIV